MTQRQEKRKQPAYAQPKNQSLNKFLKFSNTESQAPLKPAVVETFCAISSVAPRRTEYFSTPMPIASCASASGSSPSIYPAVKLAAEDRKSVVQGKSGQ